MYERSVLIAEVSRVIKECWLSLDTLPDEEDGEEKYIDIRLQLVDGTYYVHDGDSQYDTDHRGAWGASSVCESTEDFDGLAEEIVDEALDDFAVKNDLIGGNGMRVQPDNSPAALLLEKIEALLNEYDGEIVADNFTLIVDGVKYELFDVELEHDCGQIPRQLDTQKLVTYDE